MEGTQSNTLVVWRFVDGKPGHESQSLGLINALKKIRVTDSYDLSPLSRTEVLKALFLGRLSVGDSLPNPDLIIGVGHSTHMAVLAAQRTHGGQTVLLMKPSVSVKAFDLCFIPEHDRAKVAPNVVMTIGVLNTILRSRSQSKKKALILVGGPSAHYAWDTNETVSRILRMVQTDTHLQWTLTTSRRTPADCEQALSAINASNLDVVPYAETQKGWVAKRLDECRTVWVTEDSVSMVYESLTSGAGVGLLPVPLNSGKQSRVSAGVSKLVEEKKVTTFSQCESSFGLESGDFALAEAERCARVILDRFQLEETNS